jgi:hypothetical protein
MKGTIEQTLGDKKRVLMMDNSILIQGGTIHGSRNIGGEDAKMVISYSARIRKYETV